MALPLILASSSPRRQQLLREAGYEFTVVPPHEASEDAAAGGEEASMFVARLAWQKGADVARRVESGIVIACDTVAECEGRILGKPRDKDHARRMLTCLSGRAHRVYSGLCVWPVPDGEAELVVECTVLRMDKLEPADLEIYLETNAWEGKAGAFGYQDGPDWLHVVQGSETNVVGLPMEALKKILKKVEKKSKPRKRKSAAEKKPPLEGLS
jgi:septum formation protein